MERNPLRASMVNAAEDYEWSSAAAHCREDDPEQRLDLTEWRSRYDGERWRATLRSAVEQEAWEEQIRETTRRGLPLGSDQFVEQMSLSIGRDLKARPPGRPRKEREEWSAVQTNG